MRWLVWLRGLGQLGLRAPRWFWGLVSVLWMSLIWWLSSYSGGVGGDSWLWGWAGNLAHAPLFGLLALWAALAGKRDGQASPKGMVWVDLGGLQRTGIAACVLLWGLIDELHQSYVPGRMASPWDLVTDGVAAWMVLWVAAGVGARGATEGSVQKRLALSAAASLAAALVATLA